MVRRRSAGSTDSPNSSNKTEKEAPLEKVVGLEATVLDLKATLDAVQPKDSILLKQVTELKADLEAKDSLIKKLQAEVKQAEHIKAELAEAKQMILKLSEVNAKPLVAIAPSYPQEVTPTPTPAVTKPQPEPKSTLQIESAAVAHKTQHESALRKIFQHPTQPGSPPPMSSEREGQLSEVDIGWMD
jgi:DNA repair exonuclease SbcCD ATPase subunit